MPFCSLDEPTMDLPQDWSPSIPWAQHFTHDLLFNRRQFSFPGHFPTDLLSHIFEYLIPSDENQYNCRDLQNCSLVCRSWRDPAQLALLRHPVIRYPGGFSALYNVIRHRHSILKGISMLLKAPSCGNSQASQRWRRSRGWASLCKVLSISSMRYPDLRLDHFDLIRWNNLSLSVQRHNISLHHLSLTFCRFNTLEEFDDLIKSFRSISRLTLDYVRFDSKDILPSRFSKHPSQDLRTLRIGRQCNACVVVPWVLGTQCWEHIETLEIDEISLRPGDRICEAIEIFRLLEHVRCKSLRHLKLGCQFHVPLYHSKSNKKSDTVTNTFFLHTQYHSLPTGLSGVELRTHYLDLWNCKTRFDLAWYHKLETVHFRLLDLQPDSLRWVDDFLATGIYSWRPVTPGPISILFDIWLLNEHQLARTVWDGIAKMIAYMMVMESTRLRRIEFTQRGPLSLDRVEVAIRPIFEGWGIGVDILRISRGTVE